MADVLSRTQPYRLLRSVHTPDYPAIDWIIEPDLSAVRGFDPKYWTVSGDTVSLLSQAERDAIDAAEQTAKLDSIADELTRTQSVTRAFAEVVADEFNRHAEKINGILTAIDGANNLADVKSAIGAISDMPTRTLQDLRDAVRGKL